jgi:hypothetical protein
MRNKFIILCTILIIFSCAKDDVINPPCETDINTLPNECVSIEDITSTNTDFIMLDKGLQEEGTAKGIKINEEWEASIFYFINDSSINLFISTYWYDSIDNSYLLGELLQLLDIPNNTPIGCYDLTTEISSDPKLIRCKYSVEDGDITLINYTLDESKENKLEILEYDPIAGIIKGKVKASFITDEPDPGYFPEKVRFFNVDFETY